MEKFFKEWLLVLDAEVSSAPDVQFGRGVDEREEERVFEIDDLPSSELRIASGAIADGNFPKKRGRIFLLDGESDLIAGDGGWGSRRVESGLNEWESWLLGPPFGEREDIFAAGFGEGVPEVCGGGIREGVGFNVTLNSCAKGIFAEPLLEHSDDGLTFLISDDIEGIAGFRFRTDGLLNRVGGRPGIEAHRGFLAAGGP